MVLYPVIVALALIVRLEKDINRLPTEGRFSAARVLIINVFDQATHVVVMSLEQFVAIR